MSRMFLCLMPLRVRRTSEMTLGLQKIKSSVKIAGVKPSFLCFPFKMEKKIVFNASALSTFFSI